MAGKIVGWVQDSTDYSPISGAKVVAESQTENAGRTTNTGDDGHFEMSIDAGIYDVYAQASGYSNKARRRLGFDCHLSFLRGL